MVPPRVSSEYMYELRLIAENIVRERLENLEPVVHIGAEPVEGDRAQESFRESSANLANADASEVEQPPPVSPHATIDSTSTPGDSQAIPAFHIPMTQAKSLEELPSQLDFEWQDSECPNPTPVVAAASVEPPNAMEMNAFDLVSQIASEAAKNATEQLPQEET